jgi:hypothetical protein
MLDFLHRHAAADASELVPSEHLIDARDATVDPEVHHVGVATHRSGRILPRRAAARLRPDARGPSARGFDGGSGRSRCDAIDRGAAAEKDGGKKDGRGDVGAHGGLASTVA